MYGSAAIPLRRWWTCHRAAMSAAPRTAIHSFIPCVPFPSIGVRPPAQLPLARYSVDVWLTFYRWLRSHHRQEQPGFPILRVRKFYWGPVESAEPVKIRRPPGGHPSLAASPLLPDAKKKCASTKWVNFRGAVFVAPARRQNRPARAISSFVILHETLCSLYLCMNVRFAPILLKKSFGDGERNFLEPLMRFVHSDVRDHVASQKNDLGPSYWRYGASQRRSCPIINICEIFGVVRFSTFSTVSARTGPSAIGAFDPLRNSEDESSIPAVRPSFPRRSSGTREVRTRSE